MAGNRLSGKNPLIKSRGSSGNGPEWNRRTSLAREEQDSNVLRSPPPPLVPLRSGKWKREEYIAAREDYVIRGGDSPSVSV